MSQLTVTSAAAVIAHRPAAPRPPQLDAAALQSQQAGASPELREAFNQFVGETFFSQMLKSMRKTVGKPAYFHGGQAEEMFQKQLDQTLAQQMTAASADQFTGPMFEQFLRQGNAAGANSSGAAGFLPLRDAAPAPMIPLETKQSGLPLRPREAFIPLSTSAFSAPTGGQFDQSG